MSTPDTDPTTTDLVVRGEPITLGTTYDPCLPSGTTQYGIVPCTPIPTELPATGAGLTIIVIAVIFVAVGAQLRKLPKRRQTS